MDYEKKYKEALERAKQLSKELTVDDIVEQIFPELKESEEEKIRKALVSILKSDFEKDTTIFGISVEQILAWLEKQESLTTDEEKQGKEDVLWCIKQAKKYAKDENEMGTCWFAEQWLKKQGNKFKEEKTDNANKAEPKFKVGNWIVTDKNHIWLIDKDCSTTGFSYRLISQNGKVEVGDYNIVDEHAHLWTIQDAKDGDVLYLQHDGKEHIIIYKGVIKERFRTFVSAYCAYNGIVDAFCFADVSRYADIAYGGIMPATKEQRDTLIKAMTDAGYTFDFEKKKLKKIEQKSSWSEEDKDNLTDTCVAIRKFYHSTNGAQELIDWLKSLKQRMKGC